MQSVQTTAELDRSGQTVQTTAELDRSVQSVQATAGHGTVGRLVLVGTPIGNLSDFSPRAIETLRAADLIAAEDTRVTLKLLNRYEIATPLTSYHEHNEAMKTPRLLSYMTDGRTVALVTDAGMPAISDPGQTLVAACHVAGIPVSCAPGPTALDTALALSGLPARRVAFEGFLPTERADRTYVFAQLATEERTIVLYEAPHRLQETLGLLVQALGADRRIAVCRELTKIHEEVQLLTLAEAATYYETQLPRGEYVLVIEGKARSRDEDAAGWSEFTVSEHVALYESRGLTRMEAMKRAAADRGVSKREIYDALVKDSSCTASLTD